MNDKESEPQNLRFGDKMQYAFVFGMSRTSSPTKQIFHFQFSIFFSTIVLTFSCFKDIMNPRANYIKIKALRSVWQKAYPRKE
jgi:hypothetical protein